jgi:DNA uptake protein ComE-like DNA-binding protein
MFRDPNRGKVGAYYIHWIRKKTDGTEEHENNYKSADSSQHIVEDQLRVPRVNLNTADASEIRSLYRIGRKRTADLIAARTARPFETEKEVESAIGDSTFEAIRNSIRLT